MSDAPTEIPIGDSSGEAENKASASAGEAPKAKPSFLLRVLRSLLFTCVLIAMLAAALHRAKPNGQSGEAAEALAKKLLAGTGQEAWAKTGAVRWTFGPSGKKYLWDRQNNFLLSEGRRRRNILDLETGDGFAYRDDQILEGPAAAAALDKALADFYNDSFWLNPFPKIFDAGVTRSLVAENKLMVQFASGGVTPGDSYVFEVDANGRPTSWSMWVSILPLGGVWTSWDGWETLATGAPVSTSHKVYGIIPVKISDVAGAASVAELSKDDPFFAIAMLRKTKGTIKSISERPTKPAVAPGGDQPPEAPTSRPTSRPTSLPTADAPGSGR